MYFRIHIVPGKSAGEVWFNGCALRMEEHGLSSWKVKIQQPLTSLPMYQGTDVSVTDIKLDELPCQSLIQSVHFNVLLNV